MSAVSRLALVLLSVTPFAGSADEDPGARIAQQGTPKGVAPCLTCHGADGGGLGPTAYPRLAGLDVGYLVKQLKDLRSGRRTHPVMSAMAAPLSDAEIQAVAAHYARLPVPFPQAKAPQGEVAKTAEDLVQWGDWTHRGLPGCRQCHGPAGNGVGPHFPGLAAQQASYLKAQLQAFRSGARGNDPQGLMRTLAAKLTDPEIDALADYYAAQPGAAPTPARNGLVPPNTAGVGVEVVAKPVPDHGAPPEARAPGEAGYFEPPGRDAFPPGPFGEAVRRGQEIFRNTNVDPVSARYVGNDQACGNCHIDAGRLAGSSPLWAAWVAYPAYRSKTKKVDTFVERVQGCFKYSMNAQASQAGGAPSADSETIVDLTAYSFWLAQGAPTGDQHMPGRGLPRLAETPEGFDPKRGEKVYAANCAICHGEDGAGVATADGTLFPPLWGAGSYNWGAGMHAVDAAAAFVKHNMPLGLGGSLSDQDAWDVAAYINSHERPQDPRFTGDLAETAKQFHASKFSLYGKAKGPDGELLGSRPSQPQPRASVAAP